MAYMTKFFLIIFAVYFVQTEAADKYTDENRPYEFGFTIDGEQHRHEKKDKNGIIMGEFGFITADGVYHVTVYATDENGNFKILSMKNIRVKPYPTSPGAGVKKANSVNPSSATKDSIPESTKHEKITKTIISSPAKSCSHCSLPPTTTLSPSIPKDASQSTNSNLPRSNNQKHINDNFENKVPRVSQNFGYQNQNDRPDSTPKIVESHPQMSLISNRFPQTIYQGGEQYPKQQIRPINAGQQKQNPVSLLSNEGQNYQSNLNPSNVSPPSSNQDISPISRHSQGPVNENNNIQKQNIAPNQQPVLEAVNLNQENSNTYNPVQNRPQQQQNHKPGSENNQAKLQGYPNIHVSGEQTISNKPVDASLDNQPNQKYTKGDRNPKTFTNFIQQAVEPEEVARTGPNLYKPSLPNPKDFSGKPELLAAQMQIVDKNTDIHHLNPGESVGLPNGISKNDMSNLLYTFNYTLGFYGHHEKGYTNGAKQGYYFVTGRNGIRTRVDYVADETGFHPKISQEILDILSDDVPKPETEKDVKYGLKGYEFKWLYFPLETKSK